MSFFDVVKIFFVLLILFTLLYAILFYMKKYLYTGSAKMNKKFNIKVLATQMLMPKKYISFVQIQNKIFVLGISEQSVSLIDKLDNFENEQDILKDDTKVNASFFDYFKQNLLKR